MCRCAVLCRCAAAEPLAFEEEEPGVGDEEEDAGATARGEAAKREAGKSEGVEGKKKTKIKWVVLLRHTRS